MTEEDGPSILTIKDIVSAMEEIKCSYCGELRYKSSRFCSCRIKICDRCNHDYVEGYEIDPHLRCKCKLEIGTEPIKGFYIGLNVELDE